MFDPERMLGQMISGVFGGRAASDNPNRGLNAMGGFGGGMKMGAGLGVLGLAMAAYEHFKSSGAAAPGPGPLPPPPPPPMHSPMPPAAPGAEQARASAITRELPVAPPPGKPVGGPMHLLRSMIAAAHADGHLDADERRAIVDRAREAGLPADDLMALGMELAAPRSLQSLIAETPADLHRETWAAALLAIRVDTHAEQQHLDQLAAALSLSAADCQQIREQLGLA